MNEQTEAVVVVPEVESVGTDTDLENTDYFTPEKICSIRKELKWSNLQCAKEVGITKKHWARWEEGSAIPKFKKDFRGLINLEILSETGISPDRLSPSNKEMARKIKELDEIANQLFLARSRKTMLELQTYITPELMENATLTQITMAMKYIAEGMAKVKGNESVSDVYSNIITVIGGTNHKLQVNNR